MKNVFLPKLKKQNLEMPMKLKVKSVNANKEFGPDKEFFSKFVWSAFHIWKSHGGGENIGDGLLDRALEDTCQQQRLQSQQKPSVRETEEEPPQETREQPQETREQPQETREKPQETREQPQETREQPQETREQPQETR